VVTETAIPARVRAFHAMAKPSGADCNLHCAYCYYLEKQSLYPSDGPRRMDEETLEAYIKNYLDSSREEDQVSFTWQGGEPTLMGLDFFRKAVKLQLRYGRGRVISNSFQTNGVLLDDAWCKFLKRHNFLVGLSLDGPEDIHDNYRLTTGGGPSHHLVMRALRLLQRHGVEYNILCCVNRRSSEEPLRVYEFFQEAGARFIQFLPVVERDANLNVTEWSAPPEGYGLFLIDIFEQWVKLDVGETYVMNFEWALANYMGKPGAVCHHQPTCGRSVVVEYNGDVYACDHYVYPANYLGNVRDTPFSAMLDSPGQEKFGCEKYSNLSESCRQCTVLKGCWGGCPRHRFVPDGDNDINYLCRGLRLYFAHIVPYLQVMKRLIEAGNPVATIMDTKIIMMPKII
jgi:uncharacterized protein